MVIKLDASKNFARSAVLTRDLFGVAITILSNTASV